MKKIRLNAIPIICIIIFNIGLTGCTSIKDTLSDAANKPSASSPLVDNIKAIDYNQYIKKTWIIKSWNKGPYEYSSFYISKIANGEIEGKFATTAIVIPDEQTFLPNYDGYLGNLTGKINNATAKCQFSDKDGNNGSVKLVFKENDELEATIKYADKLEIYKNYSLDGTFLFRPYNLKDINGFSPFNDQCFTVDLNSWGTVKFVSGKLIGGNHIPTVGYLTSKDGDILYSFDSLLPNNVNVKAVSFQDDNKDGLKDIIIILNEGDDSSWHMAKVLFQKADGSFTTDEKLNQAINYAGKNKDIKTITDYLSQVYEKNISSDKKSTENEGASTPVPNEHSKVSNNLVYSNTKLGFSLTFPESWKGKYIINERDKGITVLQKYSNKTAMLFEISTSLESKWNEWAKTPEKEAELPVKKIASNNGIVFVYYENEQPPYMKMDDEEKKATEEYNKMVKDIKEIVNSFKIVE